MAGGNIEAIRDWSNMFFYKKEEIADFFIKIDSGLVPYKLTINGGNLVTVTINEDVETDPQTYTISTDINGTYTGIFLFHENSTIVLIGSDSSYLEYTLSLQEATIELIPLVIATSVMTSNATPNDIGVCRASGEMWYSGNNYAAWRAFQQINAQQINWVDPNNTSAWIEYEFNTPVVIKKIEVYIINWIENGRMSIRSTKSLELVASNDHTTWESLWVKDPIDYNFSIANDGYLTCTKQPVVGVFNNNIAYKYYRLKTQQCTNGTGAAIACINLYKLQTS